MLHIKVHTKASPPMRLRLSEQCKAAPLIGGQFTSRHSWCCGNSFGKETATYANGREPFTGLCLVACSPARPTRTLPSQPQWVHLRPDLFFGTRIPFLRASERPMAIACLRLFTFLPLVPLFSVPFLRLRIAPSTLFEAPREYFLAIDQSPS